ncbi:glutamine synthetase/guanido kinase [Coniochaeta sp. PMI_546]|nr:glutamine synthetase/guanido kinase [Coniochaeta sp. PMI_546]
MAFWAGNRSGATSSQLEHVVHAIRHTPIIDNHAHPLLKPEALGKYPLLSITTEASGDAIDDSLTSLAHLRAIRQLSTILKCQPTWEAVVAAIELRRIEDPDEWVAECLDGIETILVDDGLDNEDEVYSYSEHDDYTRSKCKRIVRIEQVVATIIKRQLEANATENADAQEVYSKVFDEFEAHIKQAIDDEDVVGFKSVVCYRTGLDIAPFVDHNAAIEAFRGIIESDEPFKRLQHKPLNDMIVHRTAELIKRSPSREKKPIQFHTGLGDNDITLTKSSPSHMQPFIRVHQDVPIVLLHASYPYTRDAGYLACVYPNVYTDIGEIFPFLSRDGQETAVRQALELCPWSKIVWSTDGHWFPETYLLAIVQIREVLETVICEYVRKGELGWKAAIQLVRDILFNTNNKLYHLGLEFSELGRGVANDLSDDRYRTDLELFQFFLKGRELPDFIRIYWNDLTAQPRMRMIPFRKFMSLLEDGKSTSIGITKASLSLLQNDHIAPGGTATGEYRLHPDFSSLKSGPIKGHVSMHGQFREQDGTRVDLCPRSLLERAVEFGAEKGLTFLLGFEIEFMLLKRLDDKEGCAKFGPGISDGHAWSVSRAFANQKVSDLLRDMVGELDDMGIYVEQLHAESGNGQFELVLPALPPIEAVDTLLHAREVMSALATNAGYRMTLHPKPFGIKDAGNASHVHLSISSPPGSKFEVYQSFYAGILKHLRGILAFTYSNPASYERMVDSGWSGGRWVAWGTQNRETALRKIEESHWEVKTLDGLANPYLAMATILLAGVNGALVKEKLVWGDCEDDPVNLTDNDRKELNVTEMLPATIEEALEALKQDEELTELLGPGLVERYIAVKEAELNLLNEMGEEERRGWIMERY